MDSQPSGSSIEIVFIESDNVCFILKGDSSRVGFDGNTPVKFDDCGNNITIDFNGNVYLKEYSNYEVIIESKSGVLVEFYHDNINIRNKVTQTRRGSKNLSGIINFKGDIGFTDLIVKANGKDEFKITLEVYPSKISYKEDYEEILRDVNEEIYNLAYSFLARTYLGAEINNKVNNNDTEFYSILNYVFDKLMKAINIVINNPHHALHKENRVCKYQSLRNVTNETVKWLEKRPHLLRERNGRYIPTEALQTNKIITTDTKENRFVKFILLRIMSKIDDFIKNYKKVNNCDEVILKRLEDFKRKINTKIISSFMRNIKGEYNEASLSLVLTMASGYRDIYKYYLMLQKGLSINSNIFSLSMKELSLLYEYWCFIKINSLLKKKYKLVSADFIKINRDGIAVSLKKENPSVLHYQNIENKEKFKVSYNLSMGSKTVGQKPDNVLSIYKDGYEKAYEFIFDAKYKIDDSSDYIAEYNGKGPKVEDINTMHRYRDAILYKNKKENKNMNCIFGAFVLFPYNNEEEYRNHRFYKSIDEVNIGALPFLPSSTKLIEEFLDELIVESSYSTFERTIDPIGKDEYIKDEDFTNRNVLVGSLRNKQQLAINIKDKFYHTKKTNVNLVERNIKYIALAQSKKQFGEDAGILYYGKVKDIKLVKRCDIKVIPSSREDEYYLFEIEEWKKLDNKIKVEGYQVVKVLYTSEYLLNNAETVTELCIKSKEEYRLWKELKRLNNKVEMKIASNKIDVTNAIEAISIDGIDIFIKENEIVVIINDKVISRNREEFIRKPRSFIKETLSKGY